MNIRQSILVIFTLIFFLLSVIFIGFEAREIPKDQNAVIDGILEKITPEVRRGRLMAKSVESLPSNCLYSIWVENFDQSWSPLIVADGVNIVVDKGPTWIPTELNWSARTYLKSIDNVNYVVWINKYNLEFYIKNIILVALFLLLFYLILVLIISLLFKENFAKLSDDQPNGTDDFDDDDDLDDTVIEDTLSEKKVPMSDNAKTKISVGESENENKSENKNEIKIPMYSDKSADNDNEVAKDSGDKAAEIPMYDSDNAKTKDNVGEGESENKNEIKIPMYSETSVGNDNAAVKDSDDNAVEIPMSDSNNDKAKDNVGESTNENKSESANEIKIPMYSETSVGNDNEATKDSVDNAAEIPMFDSDNDKAKDNDDEGEDENEIKVPMYSETSADNDNAAAKDSDDNAAEIPMYDSDNAKTKDNVGEGESENKNEIKVPMYSETSADNETASDKSSDEEPADENTPIGLLTRAEQIIENESAEQMFEHCVAGDENHRVKFTSAEYDALTQPLDFEDLANESDYSEEDETIQNQWKDLDLPAQAEKRNEALLEGYKNLWTKSIKSSSDFRNRFKFKDARSLQRLGQSVRQYLTKALELGQNYFNWEECGFYIKEDDKFEDCKTGMELDTSNIDIPTKGTKKGKIYVPIFPFDNENLFGYLYFTWNNIKDFKLTDVMYFLKFVFSYNAKFIFDKELQSEIAKAVNYALSKKGDCCVVSITADNKEKIQLECKDVDIQVLDALIYQRLIKDFKKFDIFQITDLKYVMIGSKVDKLKTTKMFNKWIQNKDKQVYSVKLNQNYALSFSLGAAFRSDNVDNEDTPVNMISRAESLMRISINNGGNKISIQK